MRRVILSKFCYLNLFYIGSSNHKTGKVKVRCNTYKKIQF